MWSEIKTRRRVTNCQRVFSSGGYWPLATWQMTSSIAYTASLVFLMMSMFAVAHAEPLQGKIEWLKILFMEHFSLGQSNKSSYIPGQIYKRVLWHELSQLYW